METPVSNMDGSNGSSSEDMERRKCSVIESFGEIDIQRRAQEQQHTHSDVNMVSRETAQTEGKASPRHSVSHAIDRIHDSSAASRGSTGVGGGTSNPVEESRAEGASYGAGRGEGHRPTASEEAEPDRADDMGHSLEPGHAEEERPPGVLPEQLGLGTDHARDHGGVAEEGHGKDLHHDDSKWPGSHGLRRTCSAELPGSERPTSQLLRLLPQEFQGGTTQPPTWSICKVAGEHTQGGAQDARLSEGTDSEEQGVQGISCEGRTSTQCGIKQLNTGSSPSTDHDDSDDANHDRAQGGSERAASSSTPEGAQERDQRCLVRASEPRTSMSDGGVNREASDVEESWVTDKPSKTISDSMARFLEQESRSLGPRAFQELIKKKTVLLEIACSPDSRLSAEVQRITGREASAVRCSHWNGGNLETSEGVKHCLKLIDELDPENVWISPECGPYSPMQAVNQRTPEQVAELEQKRKSALRQYVGSSCIYQYCCQKGIHVTWELAERCQAWRLPLIQKLMKRYQPYTAVTHGCRVNLRDQRTQALLHKGWRVMTTHKRLSEMLEQRCQCKKGYQHAKCESGLARSTAYYTPEYANRVAKAMLQEMSHEGLLSEMDGRTCLPSTFGNGVACVCHSLREHTCLLERGACHNEKHTQEAHRAEQASHCGNLQPRQNNGSTDTCGDRTQDKQSDSEMAYGIQQLKRETNDEEIKRKLYLLHAATGHCNTRNLVTALQKRGAEERAIQLAKDFRCAICEEGRKITTKHVASLEPLPPKLATISADGGHWTHPATGQEYEFAVVIDEGSRYRVAKIMKVGKKQTMGAAQFVGYLREGWFQFFGTPNVLRVDPSGAFRSREIEKLCDDHGIYLDIIPGEAHWHLGICEQAIEGIKTVMTKMAIENTEKDPDDLLSVAVKTFNDRDLVRGFSPSQHVLGRAPDESGKFIAPQTTNGLDSMVPNPGEDCQEGIKLRMQAEQALSEWQAHQRTNRALQSRAKPRYNYTPGELVYFWRKQISGKKPGKNGMFLGPARILAIETKRDSEGNLKPGSSIWLVRGRRLIKCCPEQLRPASEREELLEFLGTDQGDNLPWTFHRVASTLGGNEMDDISDEVPDLATWQQDHNKVVRYNPSTRLKGKRTVETIGSDGKTIPWEQNPKLKQPRDSGSSANVAELPQEEAWWNQIPEEVYQESKGGPMWDNPEALVEIGIAMPETKRGVQRMVDDLGAYFVSQLKRRAVEVSEKRLTPKEREEFKQAKHKEVNNFLSAQAFEAIPPEMRPQKEQAIGMRWILTWKQTDEGGYKAKARAILKGYQDPEYEFRATTTPVMTRQTRQLLLQVAAWRKWCVKKGDVSGTFLQGREYPNELYCIPCPEILEAMHLGPDEIVRVKRGCYGLVDAPLEWYLTVSSFLQEEGLVKTWADPCCWMWKPNGVLKGIIAGHVDDFLFCGDPQDKEWLALEKRIQERFKWSDWETDSFVQCGVKIEVQKDGSYHLSQPQYLDKVSEICLSAGRRKQAKEPTTERERERENATPRSSWSS